jgi:putative FmdB family regulatory protein
MPLFTFKCGYCGQSHDRFIGSSQPPTIQYCLCGHPMTKQPSAPAFAIKGYSAANGYSKAGG